MLELKKINRQNVWQVARLKVKRTQVDYVASNIESILEAFATREEGGVAEPFALYDGAALVGFAMIGYGDLPGEENPAISAGNYCLWRLMIDERWQGRGYGRQAIEKLIEYVRTFPCGPAEAVSYTHLDVYKRQVDRLVVHDAIPPCQTLSACSRNRLPEKKKDMRL